PRFYQAGLLIDGQVREEVKTQSERFVKDEIDKLESNWKGDLFSQMAFPIIFTVASIFAAFAVKDILTEILKDQEKKSIKQDLRREMEIVLRNKIGSDSIESSQNDMKSSIRSLEMYIYWIEHKMVDLELSQILDQMSNDSTLEQKDKKIILETIESLLERSMITLQEVSGEFRHHDFACFKKAEDKILSIQINSSFPDIESRNKLLSTVNRSATPKSEKLNSSEFKEGRYERIDNIFKVQMNLMINTLNELKNKNTEGEEIQALDLLIQDFKAYISRDVKIDSKERQSRFNESLLEGKKSQK
ncbi:MAG: hypothetical protein WBA10_17760, partial [Elainellaceae cyanobacterium]